MFRVASSPNRGKAPRNGRQVETTQPEGDTLMRRWLLGAVAGLTLAGPLSAGDGGKQPEVGEQPKGAPPKIMTATKEKDGRIFLQQVITEYRQEKRLAEVIVNGRKEKREYTVAVPIMREQRVYLDDKGVEVFGTDGKKIAK